MGGGSSVLSPELSNRLTKPSLNRFHQLQAECEAQKMSPLDMYLFLSLKYEELLCMEKEAIAILVEEKALQSSEKEVSKSFSRRNTLTEESQNDNEDKRAPNLGSSTMMPRWKSFVGTSEGGVNGGPSKGAQRRRLSMQVTEVDKSLLNKISSDVSSHDTELSVAEQNAIEKDLFSSNIIQTVEEEEEEEGFHAIHDPYLESVVGKVFNVAEDSRTQLVIETLLNTNRPLGTETTASSANEDLSFIENAFVKIDSLCDHYECLLCHMAFQSKHALEMHISDSPVHSMNLQIRQHICEKTIQEAQRLTKLAQTTIDVFKKSSDQDSTTGESNSISNKLTVSETTPSISPRKADEATSSAAAPLPSQKKWKHAVNQVISNKLKMKFIPIIEKMFPVPTGVKMLYAGSKLFYRAKASFDIHIYQHMEEEIIEIIPHLLPRARKGHHKFPMGDIGRSSGVEAYPRIYLDYHILLSAVLGVDHVESALDDHTQTTSRGSCFSSGENARIAAIASLSFSGGTNSESVAEEGRQNFYETLEHAVVSFVLKYLNVRQALLQLSPRGVANDLAYEIYFDPSKLVRSPIIETQYIPSDLKHITLSPEQIQKQYAEKESNPSSARSHKNSDT